MTLASALQGVCKALPGDCKAVLRDLISRNPGSDILVIGLANVSEDDNQALIGLANELTVGADGWVIIPYGDSSHAGKEARIANLADRTKLQIEAEKKGVVQRLTKDDAVALVNDFKSTWSRIKRAIVGLPVFKGHPDAPRFAARFPDKTPRGTIADMEARDEGLALRPVLTEQGAADVEAGWKFVSPYWLSKAVSEENGRKVVAPFKLFSLGLVPKGNIPGLSLVNAAETETESPAMIEKLKLILAALGLTIAADADETALANAADTGLSTLKSLQAAKAQADTYVTTLTSEKTKLEGEKLALANSADAEKTRATSAETKLKAERTARAKLIVTGAVTAGKIPVGELDAQTTALANAEDFDGEVAKIDSLKATLRTKSGLNDLGKSGREQQSRTTQVLALVNAAEESPEIKALPVHARYDAAFKKVSEDPKNKGLFDTMKKPEVATK